MNLDAFNAGGYEPQYEYKSFLPSRIHHSWIIADAEIQNLLSLADRTVGELNAFAQLIPDIDFFIRMYVVKEATQSSRMEGTQTNIEDAIKEVDDIAPDVRDDWSEVQNYIEAINYAIAELNSLPFSNRLLKQTHAVLLQGVRGEHKLPGEFRNSQNWIGVSLKNAMFVPPHHQHVIDLMSDLELFLHDENHRIPPLLKIAIAHYQFETIHPFLDGNGRLGRLMIPLFLASEKLLVKPALYLSDFFERHKTAYVDHLMAVREGNHLREWLIFFLYGLEETARSAIDLFKSILNLKDQLEQDALPKFSVRRQDKARVLMRNLYKQPIVDIKAVAKLLETTPNTANALILEFIEQGIMAELTGQQRNRLFIFKTYLDLFNR